MDEQFGLDTIQEIDIESPIPQSTVPRRHANTNTSRRPQTRTARLVSSEVRDIIAGAYKNEVKSFVRWRDIWKRFGDSCEAISKGLTGVSAVLAFASSAIRDTRTADILSFTSGSIGTIGLVLLTYSNYAIKESRERTQELNTLLDRLGVTPLPDINSQDSETM